MFAIFVELLSLTVLAAIPVRRRQSPSAFAVKRSTAKRAIIFGMTTGLLVAAGCAATTPTIVLTGGPPQIPHTLEGREGRCLMCHEAGLAGAPKVPAKHEGRTSDMCPLCHMPAAGAAHSAELAATSLPAGGTRQTSQSPGGREGSATPMPAAPPAAGDATAGKAVFASKSCAACHGPEAQGGIGPNLKTPKREAGQITTVVRSGKGGMPAYAQSQVSDAELQNIIAFLQAP